MHEKGEQTIAVRSGRVVSVHDERDTSYGLESYCFRHISHSLTNYFVRLML